VNVWDNTDKDRFMRDYFAGSSILWASESINPIYGGAAKADIWRYCTLFIFGGVYIDADSFLSKPMDGIVQGTTEDLLRIAVVRGFALRCFALRSVALHFCTQFALSRAALFCAVLC
jgi:hypothetical protein